MIIGRELIPKFQ